jgi:hypothetical protein
MSVSDDLKSVVGDVFDELGILPSIVTRIVQRTLTKADRARDVAATTTETFTVRALLDTVEHKADDGTLYTVTEALLDGEVRYNDRITVGDTTYVVTTVTKDDPIGAGALYWTAVLK